MKQKLNKKFLDEAITSMVKKQLKEERKINIGYGIEISERSGVIYFQMEKNGNFNVVPIPKSKITEVITFLEQVN